MELKEQLSMLEDRVKAAEALVEVLRELVRAKDQTIEALKAQPQIQYIPVVQPQYPQVPYYGQPYITCQHSYPSMWGGTGPVQCVKCGQPMYSGAGNPGITIGGAGGLCGSTDGNSGNIGVAGAGSIMLTGNACSAANFNPSNATNAKIGEGCLVGSTFTSSMVN